MRPEPEIRAFKPNPNWVTVEFSKKFFEVIKKPAPINSKCSDITQNLKEALNDPARFDRCEAIPSTPPREPNRNYETIFVNGVWNNPVDSAKSAELLANVLGRNVTRHHNNTGSGFKIGLNKIKAMSYIPNFVKKSLPDNIKIPSVVDLLNCVKGRVSNNLGVAAEDAAVALAEDIAWRKAKNPKAIIDIHAHSQGSIITANALHYLRNDLMGIKDDKEWATYVNQNLKITTYGAAEHGYPYSSSVEYGHNFDPVRFSTSALDQAGNLLKIPFKDKETLRLNNYTGIKSASHSFDEYMKNVPKFFVEDRGNFKTNGEVLAKSVIAVDKNGEYSKETIENIIKEVRSSLYSTKEDAVAEYKTKQLRIFNSEMEKHGY